MLIEVENYDCRDREWGEIVGVDPSVKALATFSNGEQVLVSENLKVLRRRKRVFSRKQKGS